jgi:hypothetical protein
MEWITEDTVAGQPSAATSKAALASFLRDTPKSGPKINIFYKTNYSHNVCK